MYSSIYDILIENLEGLLTSNPNKRNNPLFVTLLGHKVSTNIWVKTRSRFPIPMITCIFWVRVCDHNLTQILLKDDHTVSREDHVMDHASNMQGVVGALVNESLREHA